MAIKFLFIPDEMSKPVLPSLRESDFIFQWIQDQSVSVTVWWGVCAFSTLDSSLSVNFLRTEVTSECSVNASALTGLFSAG